MSIAYAPIFINEYIKEKVSGLFSDQYALPFFPTFPTDINGLTETFPHSSGTFAVFDRMFKYRRSPFPHIRSEQVLYYFYATQNDGPEQLIVISQQVYDLLDGQDESAQDLNEWIRSKLNPISGKFIASTGEEFDPVFFHNLHVYHLQESRDIVDFGSARTFAGNKLIIDYEYHKVM